MNNLVTALRPELDALLGTLTATFGNEEDEWRSFTEAMRALEHALAGYIDEHNDNWGPTLSALAVVEAACLLEDMTDHAAAVKTHRDCIVWLHGDKAKQN
jgi:hypothetical protein